MVSIFYLCLVWKWNERWDETDFARMSGCVGGSFGWRLCLCNCMQVYTIAVTLTHLGMPRLSILSDTAALRFRTTDTRGKYAAAVTVSAYNAKPHWSVIVLKNKKPKQHTQAHATHREKKSTVHVGMSHQTTPKIQSFEPQEVPHLNMPRHTT